MKLYRVNFFIFFIFFTSINYSQDLSQDFSISSYYNLIKTHTNSWQSNTSLKPLVWGDMNIKKMDSSGYIPKWVFFDYLNLIESSMSFKNDKNLNVSGWFGKTFQYSDGDTSDFVGSSSTLHCYFNYSYKKSYKAWIYSRITSNANSLPHYTGKPRKKRRLGLNSGEVDMSGFGYFKPNFQIWYGRGHQNWGAMQSDNIALSSNSPSFDQLSFQLKYDNFKYKYFHGYLETIGDNNHRYIVGKGLEYNNLRNFLLSFSEIVIYSGKNRPLDYSYVNPFNTHLEIELNNRDNRNGGTGGSNAVWNLAADYLFGQYYRLHANLLIDELGLDEYNVTENDTSKSINNFGYQIRFSITKNIFNKPSIFYMYFSRVSAYALRHENFLNNFVSRNFVLGSGLGSDSQIIKSGFEVVGSRRVILKMAMGILQSGENNILDNLYANYSNVDPTAFPSGYVRTFKFIHTKIVAHLKPNLDVNISHQYFSSNRSLNNLYFALNYQIPVKFSL